MRSQGFLALSRAPRRSRSKRTRRPSRRSSRGCSPSTESHASRSAPSRSRRTCSRCSSARATPAQVRDAFATPRAEGFDNLSLDLMFGLPGQTLERLGARASKRALELGPEHLSAYALTAEPGTRLGDAVLAGARPRCRRTRSRRRPTWLFLDQRAARAGTGELRDVQRLPARRRTALPQPGLLAAAPLRRARAFGAPRPAGGRALREPAGPRALGGGARVRCPAPEAEREAESAASARRARGAPARPAAHDELPLDGLDERRRRRTRSSGMIARGLVERTARRASGSRHPPGSLGGAVTAELLRVGVPAHCRNARDPASRGRGLGSRSEP